MSELQRSAFSRPSQLLSNGHGVKVLSQLQNNSPPRRERHRYRILLACCCHLPPQFQPFCWRDANGLSSPCTRKDRTRPQQLPPSSPHVTVPEDPIVPEAKSHIALPSSPPSTSLPNCLVLVLKSTPSVSTLVANTTRSFLLHSRNPVIDSCRRSSSTSLSRFLPSPPTPCSSQSRKL